MLLAKYLVVIHSLIFSSVISTMANTDFIADAKKLQNINEQNQEDETFQKFTKDYENILNQEKENLTQKIDKYKEYYDAENIKPDFNELVNAQEQFTKQNKENLQIDKFTINQLMIFVSSSMPINVLQQYAVQTRRAGGVMVIRGFINGSMQNSVSFIKSLSDKGTRAIIDPNAFRLFNIKKVPQIVVISDSNKCEEGRCENTPLHDKISGNITLEYALENIKNNGDFTKTEAKKFLSYLRHNKNN